MRFKEFIHQTAKTTPTKKGPATAKDIVNGASFEIMKHGALAIVDILDASIPTDIKWQISDGEERIDPIEEVLAVINHSEDVDKK